MSKGMSKSMSRNMSRNMSGNMSKNMSGMMVVFIGIVVLQSLLVACGTSTPTAQPPDAVEAAKKALGTSLDVPVGEIEVVSYEQEEWPDACLGLAGSGEMCAQVITPGWRIVLQAEGETHVFRTDETGEMVRQEE